MGLDWCMMNRAGESGVLRGDGGGRWDEQKLRFFGFRVWIGGR